ncbi:MAG: hypothetical protein SVR08_16070 [Spirochaetota bacterium]|nr:hypothetical protein [Spirochaetota bacterium]
MKNLKLDKELLDLLGWNGRLWFRFYDWKYKHRFITRAVKYLFVALVFIIFIMLIAGCNQMIDVGEMWEYDFENDIEISSVEEACLYVAENIEYVADDEWDDYWQTPQQTVEKKGGDCEDKAILLEYLLYKKLGLVSYFYLVYVPRTDTYHALTEHNGTFYEFGGKAYLFHDGLPEYYDFEWYCSYGEAVWMAVNHHNNVGKYY